MTTTRTGAFAGITTTHRFFPPFSGGSLEYPAPHCNINQVWSYLRGINLDRLRDPDGSLTGLTNDIINIFIPEATTQAVRVMRQNMDWTLTRWFFDGNGTPHLTLPFRFIGYVFLAILRVLPSQQWYRFVRPRYLDGTEFDAIGGIEPLPSPPETLPFTQSLLSYFQTAQQTIATGIEDMDLIVDRRRRMISIPPRLLYANLTTPLWNYTWLPGNKNVEVHFSYGFPPTKYTDGQPLQYDSTGNLIMLSPPGPNQNPPGGAPVDWSSGMPGDITNRVARLAANKVLRIAWRSISSGLASLSIEGASESYGPAPWNGDVDADDERIMQELSWWGVQSII